MRSAPLWLTAAFVAVLAPAAMAQPTWAPHRPIDTPTARFSSPLAYDTVRDRVVMFSGAAAGPSAGDTWEYDGRNWTRIVTAVAPTPRIGHTLVFDPISQRTLLFGGGDPAGPELGDTWTWDGATWTPHPGLNPSPSPRFLMGACYFPPRGRIVTYGGQVGSRIFYEDMWTWDGARWVSEPPTTPRPGKRSQMGFDYDPVRRRIVFVAGASDPEFHRDTWEYDGATWRQTVVLSFPTGRSGVGMAWVQHAARMVLIGGYSRAAPLGDCWAYDGTSWSSVPVPAALARREYAGMVADPLRGRAVLFGGRERPQLLDDTWTIGDTTLPTFVEHGLGCGASGATPSLSVPVPPWHSELFRCDVRVPPTATTAAMLLGSTAGTPLDLGGLGAPGCHLFADLAMPLAILPLPAAAGVATLSVALPAGLLGARIEFQGVVPDPAANALGLAMTAGGTATVR